MRREHVQFWRAYALGLILIRFYQVLQHAGAIDVQDDAFLLRRDFQDIRSVRPHNGASAFIGGSGKQFAE